MLTEWPSFGKNHPSETGEASPASPADLELVRAGEHYDNGDIELFRDSFELSGAYLLHEAQARKKAKRK